jgi:phospholipid/cholesterol/gamma-HCH transport system substrate-binding protein
MNERVVQFRVGVMVLATVFITAILIALFDGFPALVERPYTLYLRFNDAPGVSSGTPVTKSGIRIGRVTDVRFAEDVHPGESGVIVTVHIDANRKIHRDEEPQLKRALLGVGGDTTIEFVRRRKTARAGIVTVKDGNEDIPPGSMIQGQAAEDPFSAIGNLEGNLGSTMQSLARTSDEIGMLARRVNDLIQNNDEQLIRIVSKTETALDNISAAAGNANSLLGDPAIQQNIRKVAQDLPQTIAQINMAINSMQQTFEAADRNLRNFEGLTKPLGERGPQLVANIENAMQKINNVAENLADLTAAINSSDGTIGRLINDKALYEQLTQTLAGVNCMIKDLKPIVDNAKVLTDKLARHPETLGLRGAIKPSSGIK